VKDDSVADSSQILLVGYGSFYCLGYFSMFRHRHVEKIQPECFEKLKNDEVEIREGVSIAVVSSSAMLIMSVRGFSGRGSLHECRGKRSKTR